MSETLNSAFIALAFALTFFTIVINTHSAYAQAWTWPEYTMEGDTVWYTFPPPDSIYVHDKFAIKFLKGILNKDSLCYDCDAIVGTYARREKGAEPQGGDDPYGFFGTCKGYLMAQHFSLDIIQDTLVRSVLSANGVTYLTRMTAANPCADTLTVSRFGDTLPMDDFNWMVAHLNNDTSVIPTLIDLYLTYNGSVEVAEPDYIMKACSKTPNDPQFAGAPQKSLSMIGMDAGMYRGNTIKGVWERPETFPGANNIRVSVVDQGIDFWRCDLGGLQPEEGNVKIIGGYDWQTLTEDGICGFENQHGTAVASVIGALTNNANCTDGSPLANLIGMAGTVGGFGTAGTPPQTSQGTGVKIVGYRVNSTDPSWDEISVATSIRESAVNSIYGYYGAGVDAINFSGQSNYDLPNYSVNIRNAIAEAFLNGTSFIASKADQGKNILTYPSDHEPASEIIAVGASNHLFQRYVSGNLGSNYGIHTDLIAPGGDGDFAHNVVIPGPPADPDEIVDAMRQDLDDTPSSSSGLTDNFVWFGNTSAAAPQVTGAVALLRGYLQNNSIAFAREDIEGILKSSVLDHGDPGADPEHNPRVDPDGSQYITGFNDHVGWGFLNVARIFDMLDPTGDEAYVLYHIEVPNADDTFGNWSSKLANQIFYTPSSGGNNPDIQRFDVEWREVTATGSYAGLGINTNLPVYVWGNTGLSSGMYPERWFGKNRGLANLLPNWSEPWCEVTNGMLGNQGQWDESHTYQNVGVPGIYHQYSTTVSVHTYQYDLYEPNGGPEIKHYPPDAVIGMGFTVFGATKASSGVKNAPLTQNGFSIEPSLASDYVNANLVPLDGLVEFYLYDALGRTVRESHVLPGIDHFQIQTNDLTSGFYTGIIQTKAGIESAKIIVLH